MNKKGDHVFSFLLPRELYIQIKMQALTEWKTVAEVARELFREWLDD